MQMLRNWWNRLGLQARLQIMLQGTLVLVLVAAQLWISAQFEHQLLLSARERAVAMADGVVNGLNILMIVKSGDREVISEPKNRRLFIEKMAASEGIRELRVVRGAAIDEEFGKGSAEQYARDDMDRRVMASGKAEYALNASGDSAPTLRAVIPYVASKNFRGIDCLGCHAVDEGATVGAASVMIDIADDLATIRSVSSWMWGAQAVLQLLLFFALRFIVRHLLAMLGGEPRDVIDVLRRVAHGDLSGNISTKAGDETSLLAVARAMQSALRRIVADIKTTVQSAVKGDFTRQTELAASEGFGGEIGNSLNTLNANLLRQIGGDPSRAVQVATDIAAGKLDGEVVLHPQDSASILAAMVSMRRTLSELIAEVREVVDAASQGQFGQTIGVEDKQGYALTLASLQNRLSEVTEAGLRDFIAAATALASGDLTHAVTKDYPGLFGQLKDATNTTNQKLREIVGLIREATAAIDTAASEISTGNQDLSRRTQDQAASLEETSAAVDQLKSTVHQNADNARQANELAKDSYLVAGQGGEVVERVVKTMARIEASSRKIADITGVIDGIAFQTNILALNAAVEAARAGEQGRGFAVVATEVRNLAQRCATAAREIKTLIGESAGDVSEGVKLAREAGSTMSEVVSRFEKVAELVTDIAGASREQSAGIAEVAQALARMDQATQQNAAMVEESAAASGSLEQQVHDLVRSVGIFKLAAQDDEAVVAARPDGRQLEGAIRDTRGTVASIGHKLERHRTRGSLAGPADKSRVTPV